MSAVRHASRATPLAPTGSLSSIGGSSGGRGASSSAVEAAAAAALASVNTTAATGSGAQSKGTGSVRSLLEASLKSGDIGPIVKLVFDLQQGNAAAQLSYLDDKALEQAARGDGLGGSGGLGSAGDGAGGVDSGQQQQLAAEAVLALLQQIADQQNDEISLVCRANADDLAQTVQEMAAMQAAGVALRQAFVDNNDLLQTVGVQLLASLEEWQATTETRQGLADVHVSVSVAVPLLRSISRAGHCLQSGELYRAFKILDRLRDDPLFCGLQRASHLRNKRRISPGGVPSARAADAPRLGRLARFVVRQWQAVMESIGAIAMDEFNEWLAKARSEQRAIGSRAIRRAAAERQLEELLQAQRASVASSLQGAASVVHGVRLEDVAASILQAKSVADASLRGDESAAEEANRILSRSRTLLLHQEGGSSHLGRRISEADMPLLHGLDMTPLHRCVQVHGCLGRLPAVRDYYFRNRGLQLEADLEPPADLLGGYQAYIAQVVGFFVVEDRVARLSDSTLGTQAEAGWEKAVTRLRSLLESTFDGASSSYHAILMVKDFMQLAINALGTYGYHVVPLQVILSQGRARYFEILNADAAKTASTASQRDSLSGLIAPNDEMYCSLVEGLGLPAVMEGGVAPPRPAFPLEMPFSSMVPDLIKLAQRFVVDSAQYLHGLVSVGEVLPAVRQARDRMLVKVVANAMLKRVEREVQHRGINFEQCCVLVLDAIAMGAAAQQLDRYTAHNASGGPLAGKPSLEASASATKLASVAGTDGGASAAASSKDRLRNAMTSDNYMSASVFHAFSQVRADSEALCVAFVTARVGNTMRSMQRVNWLPDKASNNSVESAYITAIMLDLRQTFTQSAKLLPRTSYCGLVDNVFAFINDNLLATLAADQRIPGINIFSLQRLFNDCGHLQGFAASLQIPGLSDVVPKPMAFCELALFGRIDELLQPSQRQSMGFTTPETRTLVQLLEKYCDVRPPPGSKIPESFAKRKGCEAVAKELRQAAGMKPRYVDEQSSSRPAEEQLRELTITDSFKRQIGLM